MFVFAIFWYQLFNGFSAQVPIDPIYLMIYNLVFTSVPSLLYGIIEQDASETLLLQVPSLYASGRLGQVVTGRYSSSFTSLFLQTYRRHSFWLHIFDAFWQSMAVYFVAHMVCLLLDALSYSGFVYRHSWIAIVICGRSVYCCVPHCCCAIRYISQFKFGYGYAKRFCAILKPQIL